MNPSTLIRYFRDCYAADNRKATIWNVFHRNVEHRLVLEGRDDLLTGDFSRVPVDTEWAVTVQKAAYLARKEKELIHCSFLVIGTIQSGDTPRQVCAPLLTQRIGIVDGNDGHYYLQPDQGDRRINYPLIDALGDDENSGNPIVAEMIEALGSAKISAVDIRTVINGMAAIDTAIDTTELYYYPRLVPETQLRALLADRQPDSATPLVVVPASIAALVQKSTETRGVLNELSELADSAMRSLPLQLLLGETTPQPRQPKAVVHGPVPAILNNSQKRILDSASQQPLSVVIGPPGTGKSFTIACVAMEHMARGESVLIASKMNHAVDVVAGLIEKEFGIGGCMIRAGRKHYLQDLKDHLQALLNGVVATDETAPDSSRVLWKQLDKLDKTIGNLEGEIERQSTTEIAWGEILTGTGGWWHAVRQRYIRWRAARQTPIWNVAAELERHRQNRIHLAARLLRAIDRERTTAALRENRAAFTTFLSALRARTGSRQEDLFQTIDFRMLFRAFPIWLVNLSDIHKVLPSTTELFDLAIIDEATQCDIASCLPIIQRAKRLIVVGDPHQLRHLSFLSRERQRQLLLNHDIDPAYEGVYDYREKSILDFVNERITDPEQVVFLNEHYRSLPPIIGFSNDRFYQGALRIMTERPGDSGDGVVRLHHHAGGQSESGENSMEADAIVSGIVQAVESERSIHHDLCHSIGVLSPFRRQADYIAERLEQQLSIEAFEKHGIMVGTAYTFQGEERDIMHLSLAVSPDSHAMRLRYIDRPDAFNVAVTRARVEQHLHSSISTADVDNASLLGAYFRYLRDVDSGVNTGISRHSDHDLFVREVSAALEKSGVRVWPAYRIAGLTIDVVATSSRRNCGIDLIGYPGAYQSALPHERYAMFQRAGLPIIPIPYSQWLLQQEECIKAVLELLDSPKK